MQVEDEQILDEPFIFRRRPSAISGDMRPDWRISILLLTLHEVGYRYSATLEKLHVLNWAIRTSESRKAFIRVLNGNRTPEDVVIRCEPSLVRAIQFAEAESLVKSESLRSGGFKVILTDPGKQAAEFTASIKDCLVEEKAFLKQIKGCVSLRVINELLNWGVAK